MKRSVTRKRSPRTTRRREKIIAAHDSQCVYCGTEVGTGRVSPGKRIALDHAIPLSRGGPDSWANLVCACFTCDHAKGPLTAEEFSAAKRLGIERALAPIAAKLTTSGHGRESLLWCLENPDPLRTAREYVETLTDLPRA
jgi:hypothetical protein